MGSEERGKRIGGKDRRSNRVIFIAKGREGGKKTFPELIYCFLVILRAGVLSFPQIPQLLLGGLFSLIAETPKVNEALNGILNNQIVSTALPDKFIRLFPLQLLVLFPA